LGNPTLFPDVVAPSPLRLPFLYFLTRFFLALCIPFFLPSYGGAQFSIDMQPANSPCPPLGFFFDCRPNWRLRVSAFFTPRQLSSTPKGHPFDFFSPPPLSVLVAFPKHQRRRSFSMFFQSVRIQGASPSIPRFFTRPPPLHFSTNRPFFSRPYVFRLLRSVRTPTRWLSLFGWAFLLFRTESVLIARARAHQHPADGTCGGFGTPIFQREASFSFPPPCLFLEGGWAYFSNPRWFDGRTACGQVPPCCIIFDRRRSMTSFPPPASYMAPSPVPFNLSLYSQFSFGLLKLG